jgi:sugar phosphate isomerase/epimerase
MERKSELIGFLSALHSYGYKGPITLELDRKTSMGDIAKTKSFFEELLAEY